MPNNRSEKKFVKTILFNAKADSFYVRMNPLTKFLILLLLSTGVVLSIDRPVPELYYNLIIIVYAVIFLVESRTIGHMVHSFLIFVLLALVMVFIWWIFGDQVGTNVLFATSFLGMSFKITTLSLYISVGKVSGYAAMALLTILTVMTTRDADVVSALRRLKLPFKAVFFVSIVSRSFNILTEDMETIRQAQFSRGGKLKRTSLISKIKEFIMLSVPLTASIIRRSVEVGGAMEARGFSKTKDFTGFLDEKRFRWYDGAILAFGAAMIALPLLSVPFM